MTNVYIERLLTLMETTIIQNFQRIFTVIFQRFQKMKNIEINVKEIVDYIEMNCYNRDTISLHRLTEIGYMNEVVVRKVKK